MTKKKQFHTIPRAEVQVLLARRLLNAGIDEQLTKVQANAVSNFLLQSKMVTPDTMFRDDVSLAPLDDGVEK